MQVQVQDTGVVKSIKASEFAIGQFSAPALYTRKAYLVVTFRPARVTVPGVGTYVPFVDITKQTDSATTAQKSAAAAVKQTAPGCLVAIVTMATGQVDFVEA